MLRAEIVLTVPGHPAPKGSLRCVGGRGGRGHTLIEDNPRTKPWRDTITRLARRALKPPGGPTQAAAKGQPVVVEATFTIPRPASHYRTGKHSETIRPAYVAALPTGRGSGDTDKLVRLVLDALQDAGILPDDAQVVEVVGRKAFTLDPGAAELVPDAMATPGARIRVYPFEGVGL